MCNSTAPRRNRVRVAIVAARSSVSPGLLGTALVVLACLDESTEHLDGRLEQRLRARVIDLADILMQLGDRAAHISLTFRACRRESFSLATVHLLLSERRPVSSADVDIRYRTSYAHASLPKTVCATFQLL